MGTFMIIIIEIDSPQAVQLLKCLYFLSFYFVKKAIYDPVELFNLAFGFPALFGSVSDTDRELCERKFQLFCDVLGTVIDVIPTSG